MTSNGEITSPLREIGNVCGVEMDLIESIPSCGSLSITPLNKLLKKQME
jgi:hypothetical protein